MSRACPNCHQILDEDYARCAAVTYSWNCTEGRKLSQGFVIPFGRCENCGGSLEIVDESRYADAGRLKPIQQALQAERNARSLYFRFGDTPGARRS